MVSPQRGANKTAGLKDRRIKRNSFGWVAERSNATVLKTAEGATLPGVRIPPHPPGILEKVSISDAFYFYCSIALQFGDFLWLKSQYSQWYDDNIMELVDF